MIQLASNNMNTLIYVILAVLFITIPAVLFINRQLGQHGLKKWKKHIVGPAWVVSVITIFFVWTKMVA